MSLLLYNDIIITLKTFYFKNEKKRKYLFRFCFALNLCSRFIFLRISRNLSQS